jgi:hypothetical protein
MRAGSLISVLIVLGTGSVVEYYGDQVRIYDKSGAADGALSRKELPALPAPIVDENARGFPGISAGGRTVYVKPSDVQTRDFKRDCTPLRVAARSGSDLVARSDVGASAHVGTSDQPCIRPTEGER